MTPASSSRIVRKARIWPHISHAAIQLPTPPSAPSVPMATSLLTLFLGLAGIVVFSLLSMGSGSSGGIFLGFLAISGFTTVGSLIAFFIQRRTAHNQTNQLRGLYHAELKHQSAVLLGLQQQEFQARLDMDPPFSGLSFMVPEGISFAITPIKQRLVGNADVTFWSRQPHHPDFLAVRIGMGQVPATYSISGGPQTGIALPGPFEKENAIARSLIKRFSKLNAPITLSLKDQGAVAITGTQGKGLQKARELARSIAAHLAYHHSPDDLRIIILSAPSQRDQWRWALALPHTQTNDLGRNAKDRSALSLRPHAVASDPESILEQLTWLAREIGQRELVINQDRRAPEPLLPHLVIIVDYPDPAEPKENAKPEAPSGMSMHQESLTDANALLSKRHRLRMAQTPLLSPELSLLLSRGKELGATVLCIATNHTEVPAAIGTLVDIETTAEQDISRQTTGENVPSLQARVQVVQTQPDDAIICQFLDDAPIRDLTAFAEQTRSFRNVHTKQPELPNQVDIRLLFDPNIDIEHYQPATYWNDLSLRPPPIVGASNSGMGNARNSLRVPVGVRLGDEIQYLDLLQDGPHGLLIGQTGSGKSELLQTIITGLAVTYSPEELNFLLIDYKAGLALEAFRNLPHTVGFLSNVSGPAQIRRFITMLSAEAVRREKRVKAKEPTPRLLIIIDEFAEMARRADTVLDELFTITRVGREIGMHLLLAAQRPEGVISAKVRDYVQYRFCLRVASPEDSREVLGRTDAAQIPASIPGRGFLLHGDNQLDLFQAGRATLPTKATTQD